MNIAQSITHNDFASTMIGLAKVTPAKKSRKNETAALVMADAHSRYSFYRDRHETTQQVNGRWQRVRAAYNQAAFTECLRAAWRTVKAKRSKEAWMSGSTKGVAVSASYMASCATDGMVAR